MRATDVDPVEYADLNRPSPPLPPIYKCDDPWCDRAGEGVHEHGS